LFRQSAPIVGTADDDAHMLSITISVPQRDTSSLLTLQPESAPNPLPVFDFAQEQKKDLKIIPLLQYLESKVLPQCSADAHRIATQAPQFTVDNYILYHLDSRQPDMK